MDAIKLLQRGNRQGHFKEMKNKQFYPTIIGIENANILAYLFWVVDIRLCRHVVIVVIFFTTCVPDVCYLPHFATLLEYFKTDLNFETLPQHIFLLFEKMCLI